MGNLGTLVVASVASVIAFSPPSLDAKIIPTNWIGHSYQSPLQIINDREIAVSLLEEGEESLNNKRYYTALEKVKAALEILDRTKGPGGDFKYSYANLLSSELNYELSRSRGIDEDMRKKFLESALESAQLAQQEYRRYIEQNPGGLGEYHRFSHESRINSLFANIHNHLGNIVESLKFGLKVIEMHPTDYNIDAFVNMAVACPNEKFSELVKEIRTSFGNNAELIIKRILDLRQTPVNRD